MNRVIELAGIQVTLSLNPESNRWEVWAAGLCEDFTSRINAVWHMRRLARSLGWHMSAIPPGF